MCVLLGSISQGSRGVFRTYGFSSYLSALLLHRISGCLRLVIHGSYILCFSDRMLPSSFLCPLTVTARVLLSATNASYPRATVPGWDRFC